MNRHKHVHSHLGLTNILVKDSVGYESSLFISLKPHLTTPPSEKGWIQPWEAHDKICILPVGELERSYILMRPCSNQKPFVAAGDIRITYIRGSYFYTQIRSHTVSGGNVRRDEGRWHMAAKAFPPTCHLFDSQWALDHPELDAALTLPPPKFSCWSLQVTCKKWWYKSRINFWTYSLNV